MRTRAIAAIAIVVLALIAGDVWLRSAETLETSRFIFSGGAPWCTVLRSGVDETRVDVLCRWLSEEHCRIENQLQVAERTLFCVPRPR